MFDKVSEAAEHLATHVSRRAFLGRRGRGGKDQARDGVKMIRSGGFCPPGYIFCGGHCVHWTHIIWCG